MPGLGDQGLEDSFALRPEEEEEWEFDDVFLGEEEAQSRVDALMKWCVQAGRLRLPNPPDGSLLILQIGTQLPNWSQT